MTQASDNNGAQRPRRHWMLEYVFSTIGWPTDEDDRPDLTAIQALNLPPGTKPSTLHLLGVSVSGFYKAQMPLMAAAKTVCHHVPGWQAWANLMDTRDPDPPPIDDPLNATQVMAPTPASSSAVCQM